MAYAQTFKRARGTSASDSRAGPAPLKEREACCGSAGTFNLEQPALAWQLARDKAQDAIDTGAQCAITANPGCLMQIRAGMDASGGKMTVRHIAEVLADAYRQEEVSHD